MKIKYALLFLLMGLPFWGRGKPLQLKPGDTLYYSVHRYHETGSAWSVARDYIVQMNVLNRHGNKYHLKYTLLYASIKQQGDEGFYFRSDDIHSLPSNNNCLPAIALLNKPVLFSIDASGKHPEIQNLDSISATVIHQWHLTGEIEKGLNGWMHWVMNATLSPIWNDSLSETGVQVTVKKWSKKPNVSALNQKQLLTRIWMSSYSDSLKTGGVYDSAKVMHFLAMNDKQFSRDSAYVVNKLRLLQRIKKYKKYGALLTHTPSRIIRSFPALLFNKLQNVYQKDPDSAIAIIAFFYKTKLFNDWIHDVFAHYIYTYRIGNAARISKKLLAGLLQQPDSVYQYTLEPMQLWLQSRKTGDREKLRQLAVSFEKLGREYLWLGRSARYGLLLYKELTKAGMNSTADALLNHIITGLEKDQKEALPGSYVTDIVNNGKLINKNLLAYAYYLEYKNTLPDTAKAVQYLQQAAMASPANNKETASESYHDQVLLHSKRSYIMDYAAVLTQSHKTEEVLKAMTRSIQMKSPQSVDSLSSWLKALKGSLKANPLMMVSLRSIYDSLRMDSAFFVLFENMIKKGWKKAPGFQVKDLQGNSIALEDYRGRWLLLDFWGTWCAPCREEMPGVQDFYDNLMQENIPNISLLAIASYDKPEKVRSFLKTFHYTMPVAMAGDSILRKYEVSGYPSKVLISPDGTRMPIRYGKDWEGIAKEYTRLYGQYLKWKKGQLPQVKAAITD